MSGGESGDSVERVRAALAAFGLAAGIRHFDQTTRSAAEAAAAIGCAVAEIAKSLVFRIGGGERAVLVIASGANRVDERKIAAALGASISRADAAFVRAATGFAIGGVAPIGHTTRPVILIDADLFRHETVWAAAGSPFDVFPISPDKLREITAGLVLEVA